MNQNIQNKFNELQKKLKKHNKLVVAFSGGVDSTLLAFSAIKTLGKNNVKIILVNSPSMGKSEFKNALKTAKSLNMKPLIIELDNVRVINTHGNDKNRCYYCKKEIFTAIINQAKKLGYTTVIEGTNIDDLSDYRPGKKALDKLGVLSPYIDAKLTKHDVRLISKEHGLKVWDKPSTACLISRFPYNVSIDYEELEKIEKCENYLNKKGFSLCRVRKFNDKAVVEVHPDKIEQAFKLQGKIEKRFKKIGFKNVEIDKNGYRTGRMNENVL